ncbi:MAG TPA: molybdopterin-dependent oxidoreductase, partial [Gammaproteobacteria bacterium]|nr:molybdopterin-dependent oxidoreductase [Gammaproteobacteria bacterium]
ANITQAKIGEIPTGANASGAWIAGFIPHRGPVGETLDLNAGKTALEMLHEPLASMVLMNFEPEFDAYHPALSLETLTKVQEVICITPFVTDRMRSYASILLPMALSSETDGTFINMTSDWQSFKAVAKPYGNSKPAWKILRVLANLFKLPGFQYNKAKEITFEIRKNFEQAPVIENQILHKIPEKIEPPLKDRLIRLAPMAMYRTDSLVRRAQCLQETIETQSNKKIGLHPETADHLQIQEGAKVKAQQQGRITHEAFEVQLNPNVPKGSILLYAGFEETLLGAPYSVITLERVG